MIWAIQISYIVKTAWSPVQDALLRALIAWTASQDSGMTLKVGHATSAAQGPSWTQLKQSQPATRALHHAQHAQETQPNVKLVSQVLDMSKMTNLAKNVIKLDRF